MFFIDVQGTLIDDINRKPINGSIEFLSSLKEDKVPYLVITNNTKYESMEFLDSLNFMGFNIPKESYLDPFSLLDEELSSRKVAPFGQQSFIDVIRNLGYEIDYENPDSLIVSIKKEYDNEDYSKMIEIALKCDELIGMHETSIYSKDGKRYPGVGAIMQMIKFAVNKDYKVVGKPSFNFYNEGRKLLGADEFSEITIISDDMIGDLVGAKKLGMKTILVLSGKIRDAKEVTNTLEDNLKPDFICKDISEVDELYKKGKI